MTIRNQTNIYSSLTTIYGKSILLTADPRLLHAQSPIEEMDTKSRPGKWNLASLRFVETKWDTCWICADTDRS